MGGGRPERTSIHRSLAEAGHGSGLGRPATGGEAGAALRHRHGSQEFQAHDRLSRSSAHQDLLCNFHTAVAESEIAASLSAVGLLLVGVAGTPELLAVRADN